MSKNHSHLDDSPAPSADKKGRKSEDPRDGNRQTDPPAGEQNQATVEEFEREGMGVSPKE